MVLGLMLAGWLLLVSAYAANEKVPDVTTSLAARSVPELRGYVNDYAGMITAGTKVQIEEKLKTLEQSDSTQIFVLTVPSLEGEVLEEFAIKVFDKWKAGQKGKDNGVILIVAQKERKVRIEVGRGLEGKLTDLAAGRIIDDIIKPRFKSDDFNGGFLAGVDALVAGTKGEFKAKDQNLSEDSRMAVIVYDLLSIFIQRAERLLEFIFASTIMLLALYVLRIFLKRKGLEISMAVGAAALPVIAFFTIWDPVIGVPFMKNSLVALLFYVVAGGAIGALVSFVFSSEGRGSGGSSGGSSNGSWSSSSGSSSSSSSGGGGGSSGGGGASGDY
ncbi:MAG: TPM domain-containing protein [Nitrospirae bacterium]|nr:TPM domain-containing protein [Nitrospirota bacterium]